MSAITRGSVYEDAIDGHPGLVAQADDAIIGAISTVLVIPLTDAGRWGGPARWVHICERKRNGFLAKDSAAIVPWVIPVKRKTLTKCRVMGKLHADDLDQVEAKIELIFGL